MMATVATGVSVESQVSGAVDESGALVPLGAAAADPADERRKAISRGTHRVVDPEVTLERIRPLMPSLGITRIANVTGLDVLGLPVVNVCRPNSRSNAVFQGKGVTLAAAKVSGLMEAIETYYAERILLPLKLATAEEMRAVYPLADLDGLPRMRDSRFSDTSRVLWIEGREVSTDRALWLPFETVHADFTIPHPAGGAHFVVSTNGLASGNSALEALSHGICEVIERDAATLFHLTSGPREQRRVRLDSIDEPVCADLIDRILEAGLAIAVWDITTDIGIATFWCVIIERKDGPRLLALPAEGHGCHPDRAVALTQALMEAAQARVTAISATRDDIGARFYGRAEDPAMLERWREVICSGSSARNFSDAPHRCASTLDDAVAHQLASLRKAGIREVVSVDISPSPNAPVSVVRVVIPGLEGMRHGNYAPGPRARLLRAGRR